MKERRFWFTASVAFTTLAVAAIDLGTGCGQSNSQGGSGGPGGGDNGMTTSGSTASGSVAVGSGSSASGTASAGFGSGTSDSFEDATANSGSASTGSSITGPASNGGANARSGEPVGDAGTRNGSSSGSSVTSGTNCLQKGNGDYSKNGPYQVATMAVDLADAGLESAAAPTTFTIYYPTPMEANCPHPIAAWGNGTSVTGQTVYSFFNKNVASWGIVVIASDNPSVAASPYLSTGINYLLAQNKNKASIFYNKLSGKAGVAGHSQGGIAATAATTNPAVVSEVCVEGGGIPKQGTSVLCLTGSITDGGLNPVNAIVVSSTYPATGGPAFLADWDGGDHITTPTLGGFITQNPGTIQFVRLMTAWYRCFLASDDVACHLFEGGSSCGICKDPGWYKLESKNIP